MKKYCWKIDSYQDGDDLWFPRVILTLQEGDTSRTIPLSDKSTGFETRDEADNRASEIAREYMINKT